MSEPAETSIEAAPSLEIQTVEDAQQQLATVNDDQGATVFDRISDPLAAFTTLGEEIAKSGLCGCTKKEQGTLIAIQCFLKKTDPISWAQEHHIVAGRVTMQAASQLARYLKSGRKIRWKQFDDDAAIADFIDLDGHSTEVSFTKKEAAGKGYLNKKGPWATNRAEMLRARCLTKAIRMLAPHVLGSGAVYSPEEINDINPNPTNENLFNANSD